MYVMDDLKHKEATTGAAAAAPLILVVILLTHMLTDYICISLGKKKGTTNIEEVQVMQEIKRLLKDSNSLSTPSTFAQGAKLRRAAATKEKELLEIRQKSSKDKSLLSKFQLMGPQILKACIYLGFAWCFWGVPVAGVPTQLLQPFGHALSWRVRSCENDLVMIGIIPWLLLTTRVSAFVSHKFISKQANGVTKRGTVS